MSISEWSAIISVAIALILAVLSVINFFIERSRRIELKTPIFVVERVENFNGIVVILIKNSNDNYFIIKNVSSDNPEITLNYKGVFTINDSNPLLKKPATYSYQGHAIELKASNELEQFVSVFISGVSIGNREFIVKIPILKIKNGIAKDSAIQGSFLEFIKK